MSKVKVMLVRYVGVALSAVIALLSLKVFLNYSPQDGATLIAMVGWLLFVPVMQFGYGRPCYAIVRQKREAGEDVFQLVKKFTNVFSYQAMGSCFVLLFITYILAVSQEFTGEKSDLLIFALGLASLSVCTLKRDLAYSLDVEIQYETLETLRRLFGVFMYLGLYYGLGLLGVGVFGLIVGVSSFFLMRSIILSPLKVNKSEQLTSVRPELITKAFRVQAFHYWGFTFSELVFYNIPLIVFTLYPSAVGMAYYGVWSKFFLFLALPYRIFIDTKMNSIISLYFNELKKLVRTGLKVCIISSAAIAFFCFFVFYYLAPKLAGWIGGEAQVLDPYFMISLALWVCGNIIQHTFGSFVLSYGGGFKFSFIASLICVGVIGTVFSVSYSVESNVGYSLFLAGIVYALFSITYFIKAAIITTYKSSK